MNIDHRSGLISIIVERMPVHACGRAFGFGRPGPNDSEFWWWLMMLIDNLSCGRFMLIKFQMTIQSIVMYHPTTPETGTWEYEAALPLTDRPNASATCGASIWAKPGSGATQVGMKELEGTLDSFFSNKWFNHSTVLPLYGDAIQSYCYMGLEMIGW